MIVRERTRAQA